MTFLTLDTTPRPNRSGLIRLILRVLASRTWRIEARDFPSSTDAATRLHNLSNGARLRR